MRWSTFALMTSCVVLMIGSAFAQGTDVPGDSNGDKIVSAEEVAAAEKLADDGKLSADELQEIKHIHEKYPITITDSANRTVTIYKPVKRMISQGTYAHEAICLLEAQDRIVAVTNTAQQVYEFIPGIKEKPTIGDYREVDYEKVIENLPDVYFVGSSSKYFSDAETKLAPLGTTIVVLGFSKMSMFEKEFRTLARLLEEDEKVEEILTWRESYLNMIREKTADVAHNPRVYVEYPGPGWTWKTPINYEVVTRAGGFNIGSTLNKTANTSSVVVSPEWVMTQNPEVIILPAFVDTVADFTGYHVNSTDNDRKFIEDMSNRTGLENIDAVKNGRIYVLDGETGSACRGVVGVCYCAKWFYPEIFKDLNPDAINREYFEDWLGAPYKGIWAYPQAS